MRSISVRRLVHLLGIIVALATAILIPIGYGLIGYVKEAKRLAFKAELSADRAAQYIYVNSTLWQYQPSRLENVISLPGEGWDRVVQRIYNAKGELILRKGDPLPFPTFARSKPIVIAGTTVARIEVEETLRPLLVEAALMSLATIALGFLAYFAFAIVPLRVLDRTLGALETSNKRHGTLNRQLLDQTFRFDTALENMSHGLCMFDKEQRLVVANDQFAKLYGLTPEQIGPGTTLRQIVEHNIASGLHAGSSPEAYMNVQLAPVVTASDEIHQLTDGRSIAVAHRPMPGGGWVTTHQDITRQRCSEAKIAHMALHDALTGLPNRVLLNERLEQALTRVKRGEIMAIHFLDLDRFKQVNDTLGHPTGDKLLKMVAERLLKLVRASDTIARMGGDEFAILQVAISQPTDATLLAQRVIEEVSAPYDIDGQQVIIGTSVGIAVGPTDGDNPEQLMRNADLALYRAKSDGRGNYCFFEPGMDAHMQMRRAMEGDLRTALVAGQFELYYQPIVSLDRNEINSVEALIRWHHPEKGMLAPSEFIPLAEEIGLIVPIGEWVLRNACATAAEWPDSLRVAVNVSPVQFRNSGLVQLVASALAASGLKAGRLELEITETVLLQGGETTLDTLFRLRELGVRIAMDDFGTGYSSLSYLQSFPFDKIKIDRSFIKNIAEGGRALDIVRAVAAMANGLGIVTTAEGVETTEQRNTVESEGCTEMQGFLFSEAQPAHAIEKLFLPDRKNGKDKNTASAA